MFIKQTNKFLVRPWFAGLVLLLAACRSPSSTQSDGILDLAKEVPFGANRSQVIELLRASQAEEIEFDEKSQTLYTKLQKRKADGLVVPVDLFEFVFSTDDRLIELRIKRRFVGP